MLKALIVGIGLLGLAGFLIVFLLAQTLRHTLVEIENRTRHWDDESAHDAEWGVESERGIH